MIDGFANIDRANIQIMTSARPNRIYLPYNGNGIYFHVGEMLAEYVGAIRDYPDTARGDRQLCEDVTAMMSESTIEAYLMLQPTRTQPRAGLVIDVDTPDGQRLHRSIYAPNGSEIAAEIISRFLAAGAPGLRDDIRRSLERQHCAFMERAILSGGAGLRPELREFCEAFASAVRTGMTPEQIIAAITD